jgi:hypothetical protein
MADTLKFQEKLRGPGAGVARAKENAGRDAGRRCWSAVNAD